MSIEARSEYAKELEELKVELMNIDIPYKDALRKTIIAIDGTLKDIYLLQK
jgi:hypothetical protein